MKDFKCDICLKQVKEVYDLNTLVKPLQTNTIKEICDDCLNKISDLSIRLKLIADDFIIENEKSFIQRLKDYFNKLGGL